MLEQDQVIVLSGRIIGNIIALGASIFSIVKFIINRFDKKFKEQEDGVKALKIDHDSDIKELEDALKTKADISEVKELKRENKEDHKTLFDKVDNLPFKIIELLKASKEG